MRIWKIFSALSRAKQIFIVVFLLHFTALFTLCAYHFASRQKPHRTRIAVRTVRPPPTTFTAQRTQKSAASSLPSKAATAVKKTSPAKKKDSKQTATPRQQITSDDSALIREIAENLAVLSEPQKSASLPKLSLPSTLPKTLRIEETDLDADSTYGETLIGYLQSALDLPEYGEVVAKLEIDRKGHLVHCEILEARNQKNGEFLKKRLPELPFPWFNDPKISNETLTFTITFKNVENSR
jgi:hypothetical protein